MGRRDDFITTSQRSALGGSRCARLGPARSPWCHETSDWRRCSFIASLVAKDRPQPRGHAKTRLAICLILTRSRCSASLRKMQCLRLWTSWKRFWTKKPLYTTMHLCGFAGSQQARKTNTNAAPDPNIDERHFFGSRCVGPSAIKEP